MPMTILITNRMTALATALQASVQPMPSIWVTTWLQFPSYRPPFTASPATALVANTPVGTGGTAITEAVVDAAETALFSAKVPPSQSKYLVVDPATYGTLRQIPRFSEYSTAGDAGLRALVDGSVGKMKDFYIFRSQFVAKTGSCQLLTATPPWCR